ncbi:MAG: excinuclease ABC subunit UvrA [Candidatus Adiutrix sp.]|nr:excinuclease ABC subunit UvrA [Candidatus Adiutrix sp.]
MNSSLIIVRGAREHNLKNLDVDIPRDALTVITGLSGSGKSSLAFDTLYAEGQRRYVESLSAYARQFLEQMDKPDVDLIEGLSPAISIEQKTTSKNPRSTVGTVTEIHDYLRLLFARAGEPHCHQCGRPIKAQTVVEIVDRLLTLPAGTKLILLAPVIGARKGEHAKLFDKLRKNGFVRVRVNGVIHDLSEEIALDKKKKHDIEVVVDRLVVKDNLVKRLTGSVELALRTSEGALVVALPDQQEDLFFSERFACDYCGISFPELSPQLFSFNNPLGACPQCDGLGANVFFDPDLVVPNPGLSLREGAVAPWARGVGGYYASQLQALADHYQFDFYAPFEKLPGKIRQVVLYGSGREQIDFYFEKDDRRHFYQRAFEGVLPNLERRFRETDSPSLRDELEQYMNHRPCPACGGARLRPEALAVLVAGQSIRQISDLPVAAALAFFNSLKLPPKEAEIGQRLIKEIKERLTFLNDVGLGYLSLSRSSATISGGESQRIRLATQIGSRLVGVMYILDEPSIGLHQRDNAKLLTTLKKMRDLGNTVLVVEHDADTILAADHVLDLGPGAGVHGGELIFSGPPARLLKDDQSLTGLYLSGRRKIETPPKRRLESRGVIAVKGARSHNLKNIDVEFPVGVFTCVTGVSGSGKSTLVLETLYKALAQKLYHSRLRSGEVDEVTGLELVDKVIDIDQSPIGRTPRSNPATYTGIFTPIRDLFSRLPEARARGYAPGRFSFNVKGGRCESCQGDGIIKIEMHFLPDVYVKCEACQGLRYSRDTLEVKYRDHSIAQVLDLTVSAAVKFFENVPAIREKLVTLEEVGLGYIRLGQPATTLSGGEAQRIKLSKELSRRATGRTIYILDEPTTGLHFEDIKKLLEVLTRLVDQGNTVIVIEHNLDVIKCADYIIDLGPEGGDGGGRIIAQGPPEVVAKTPGSHTGRFLARELKKGKNK